MSFFSPAALLLHFQEFIPKLTDKFSDNALVTGEIIDGDPQILRVTDNNHGLTEGKKIVFVDGKISNPITAVQLFADPSGNVLRFTTESDHDLTKGYTASVELSGFTDSGLNGEFALVDVPNRKTFEIEYPTLPILNGNEALEEIWEVGVNGLLTISNVIDVNTYEISLDGKPNFTPGTLPQLKRASNMRMEVAVDAERASAVYNAEKDPDKLWLFVIMGNSTANKDRNLQSDAVQANTAQNDGRVLMINTFSVNVYFPTIQQKSGANASEQAWNEILTLMLYVGSGLRFDDFGNTRYLTTMIDHGSALYNNAYYSHSYTYEYNYEVTLEQSKLYQFVESRAFRDNGLSFNELSSGSNLDLDEESLT